MVDFIQTFQLDEALVDFIMSNLTIEETENINSFPVEIPEIHRPMTGIIHEYVKQIEEYNYFPRIDESTIVFETGIKFIPKWTTVNYRPEPGRMLNFYVFLKDTKAVLDIFNPFIPGNFVCRPIKGLVVVFPAIWMIVYKFSSTLDSTACFIMGTTYINDLDDMQESGSSNVITETTFS
jgi:hypothetical protein